MAEVFLGLEYPVVLDRIAEIKRLLAAMPDSAVQAGMDEDLLADLANLEEAEAEMRKSTGLDRQGPVWANVVQER